MQNNSTPTTPAATYGHETMTRRNYRRYLATLTQTRRLTFRAPYSVVEYMNSPVGLIVLAHHNDIGGQIDGLHPSSLSSSVEGWASIIEELNGSDGYAVHYIPRKWQGRLVHAAFGRMIDQGDTEAPAIVTEGRFTMEVISTGSGPIVGLLVKGSQIVHIIRPRDGGAEMKEAA